MHRELHDACMDRNMYDSPSASLHTVWFNVWTMIFLWMSISSNNSPPWVSKDLTAGTKCIKEVQLRKYLFYCSRFWCANTQTELAIQRSVVRVWETYNMSAYL